MPAAETERTSGARQSRPPGEFFNTIGVLGLILFDGLPGLMLGGDRTRSGNRRLNAVRQFFREPTQPVRPSKRRGKASSA
jgi:hypothetical protein